MGGCCDLTLSLSIVTNVSALQKCCKNFATRATLLCRSSCGPQAVKWEDYRQGTRQMGMGTQAVLAGQVEAAAKAAGLVVASSEVGQDFSGNPTTRVMLAPSG